MDRTTHRILRAALAVVFLYAPIAAFIDPVSWIGYVPSFLRGLPVEATVILHAIGIIEVGLAIWFLIGKRLLVPSTLATIFLLSLVALNTNQLSILFRDIPLAFVAIALGVDAWKHRMVASEQSTDDPAFS